MKWFNWFKKKDKKHKMYNCDEVVYYRGRKWSVIKGVSFNGSNHQNLTLEIVTEHKDFMGTQYIAEQLTGIDNSMVKPVVRCKAFQPDWNQAPKGATMWRMAGSGDCYWGLMADCGGYSTPVVCGEAPTFGYNGCYTKSFRRRP